MFAYLVVVEKKIKRSGGDESIQTKNETTICRLSMKNYQEQQESLDELFGFAESYQIYNFIKDPKKFIKTLDDMANIRKASNKTKRC